MALTRKYLAAMGIEESKIEQIIEAHTEVTNALKAERDSLQEKADKYDDAQKELGRLQKENKAYKDAENGTDSWKAKYDQAVADKATAEKALSDYKAEVASKELSAKRKAAYKDLLREMKVSEKRFDAILKVTDLSKMDFDKDGKLKDADKFKESIKSDWSDFITTQSEKGAGTPNPPIGTGAQGTVSNGQSRAAQLAAKYHADLYGAKKEG